MPKSAGLATAGSFGILFDSPREEQPVIDRQTGKWIRNFALCLLAGVAWACAAVAEDLAKMPDTVVPLDRNNERHKAINERARKGNVDLLFIGDSITQGWEGAGKDVWKSRYEARNAMNAGIGGDQTQHVLWRLENGNIDGLSPKLIVLMIGTNNFGSNSAEEIALGVKAIVKKLREKLPESKILVLGVFPRGEKPDDPLRVKNLAVNAIIKDVADGKMVDYQEINDKLMNADGTQNRDIMPDLVHLSPRGYQIWADAIEPKVAAVLPVKEIPIPELPDGAGKVDQDAPKSFTTTKSGLKYRILRKGDGPAPKPTNVVRVNYHGWLDEGKVFDSSYKRAEPATFPLNRVIKGWTEGLQLMNKGGMIELEIPATLAYGDRGAPPDIRPGATLHFLVELLDAR
jgi:beta-glucosidase